MQQHVAVTDLAEWIRRRAGGRRRFLFGITGSPGSGKSTLAAWLARSLSAPIVPMDGFHLDNHTLDERGLRHLKGAPDTFDAGGFVEAVGLLRVADTDVLVPDFDREADESRADAIRVAREERIVIVEGNYLLLDSRPWSSLRDLLDTVAHLDLDVDRRVERLVARHVAFGRSVDEAVRFVEESDERNAALVEATRHRADIVIGPAPGTA